ncbi:hypothetical protein UFOVP964_58 [uncultured Caudovirales phage]|uniref:PD-(D/E)XK endonuclease-like domain-containing protein n=1 Tax=uncultured Caudovirales phage TaxID=2100421 RepID=A0A6J5P580_9CAUD|nr:hypothetical protein UFOVP854_58 [uncultured Caudovirales phage]CAB4174525.1 hypothetical protein UFOVP964_58 [uncultured Caudovirales phage]CAB4179417.1 hypothetical protein UFOVP1034_100 [uncultured Caudovirales phage]CAB4189144.1 hypothetical protein UFOVP1177_100 [uncultured Caudovirales phage]CAB4193475.1 hypothetical protein UFOVP1243_87 [uncultured Caudovirales phage]
MEKELKKFLDAKKTTTRLLGDVERHLMRRTVGDRSTTVLHPSEIIKPDWCHRYSYHLMVGGEAKKDKPNLRLQNIFDEGHYIHAKWQSRFQEMGVLYGKFKCGACRHTTFGLSPSCELCGREDTMVYDEITLIDTPLRIAGHTDGWIKGLGSDCLIEIKSIGAGTLRFEAPEILADAGGDIAKAFNNIRRPFRSHLLQGQMYLELAYRMYGEEAPKEIVFLYENKADQATKEFTVKADYEIVERIFFSAQKVIKAIEEGHMPECNVSPSGCKSCNSLVDLGVWGA